jgi:hypothetical protein
LTAGRSALVLAVVFGGLLAMAVWFGVAVTSPFVETYGTFSVDWYLIDVRQDDSVLVLGAQRIDPEGRSRDILCDDVAVDVQAVDFADLNVVIKMIGRPVDVDPEHSRRTAGCDRRESLGRVEVVLPRPLNGRPLVGCSHSDCSAFVAGRTLSDELLARVDAMPRTPSN